MMKKLLITLRHPGPVQAVFSVIPYLVDKYQVFIVASNSGLVFLLERYSEYLYMVNLYYSKGGEWVKYTSEKPIEGADSLEYNLGDINNIKLLTLHLAKLITECSIDIVLRTTPAIKWGLDEIAADACAIALNRSKCICYQEDYACGNNLKAITNPIAVVDDFAGQILTERGMEYYKVGWISQSIFSRYPPYREQRTKTRNQLQLKGGDTVILYAMGATGAFEEELNHFKFFLEIEGCKLYYKFHPRNTRSERQAVQREAKGKATEMSRNISYEGALSFADYIVSVASAMNQDALQYQIETGENKLSTFSVYTKGIITDAIIYAALGRTDLPQLKSCMGSILIEENKLGEYRFQITESEKKSLYKEVGQRFGLTPSERIANMLNYIEGVK